jgi:REP element-mobilizing transposase RayT
MPQSFACVHVHYIWSTKNRAPLIAGDTEPQLFAYIGGIARNEKCSMIAANGMPDHVHLLVSNSREIALADLARSLKANSSRWLHEQGHADFAWQNGYAAFAVSLSNVPAVKEYIRGQKEHHAKVSYQDEFRSFLKAHGLEWDERYVWD